MLKHRGLLEPGVSIHIDVRDSRTPLRLVDEAIAVNAKLIRFDILWRDIEPVEGAIDYVNLYRYREIVEYIVRRGLKPIAVIGTGYPRWFLEIAKLRKGSGERIIDKVYEYSYTVAKFLKPYVEIYQLGNELNHPLNPLPRSLRIEFLEALGIGVSSAVSNCLRIVNIIVDIVEWKNYLRRVLNTVGSIIDIVGVDRYPRTWSFIDYSNWDILRHVYKEVKRSGKTLAITEVGFATKLKFLGKAILRREVEQVKFINSVFRALARISLEIPITFVIWYMLWDENPEVCEPIEGIGWCGWGLLRSDYTRKLGWYTLRTWFNWLNRG